MADATDELNPLRPWDAADFLKTNEDAADFLAAALETGELQDITYALAAIARARGVSDAAR
jgi:probable addiction module antidote protein